MFAQFMDFDATLWAIRGLQKVDTLFFTLGRGAVPHVFTQTFQWYDPMVNKSSEGLSFTTG